MVCASLHTVPITALHFQEGQPEPHPRWSEHELENLVGHVASWSPRTTPPFLASGSATRVGAVAEIGRQDLRALLQQSQTICSENLNFTRVPAHVDVDNQQRTGSESEGETNLVRERAPPRQHHALGTQATSLILPTRPTSWPDWSVAPIGNKARRLLGSGRQARNVSDGCQK